MKAKEEKKGLLARLAGRKKPKQSPCCGGFVVEEVTEREDLQKGSPNPPQPKKNSCCG